MHIPKPPKGDSAETWRATIRAFNMVFEDVIFEGYTKRQLTDWVKHEIIDTADITDIERMSLTQDAASADPKSNTDIIRQLIEEKCDFYQNQIVNLQKVIQESEQQASIFGDEDQYNQARKSDIERYISLLEELSSLKKQQFIPSD